MRSLVALLVTSGCGRFGFDEADRPDASPAADAKDAPDPDAQPELSCLGTAACYRFDTDDVVDASGNGNDAVASAAGFAIGHSGHAILLGSSSNVLAPESVSLSITMNLTVDAWVRLDELPPPGSRSVVVDHDSSYVLWIESDGRLHATLAQSGSNDLPSTLPDLFPIGVWQHVAMTYDGTTLTAWLDASVAGSKPSTGPIDPDPGVMGLRIGGNLPDAVNPADDRFIGAIDSLRIWNRVLPQTELDQATR